MADGASPITGAPQTQTDARLGEDVESVDFFAARKELHGFAKSLSGVSNLHGAWAVGRQWAMIAAAWGAAVWSGHWAVYVLAALFIGTRQHALGVLVHDATHYSIFRPKWLNDLVCDLTCALPVGMTVSRYRFEHMLHHRFVNTDRDPYWRDFEGDPDDWLWPRDARSAAGVFFRDFIGLGGKKMGKVLFRWSPWANHFGRRETPPALTLRERLTTYGFYLAVAAAVIATGAWIEFAVLWIVPWATVLIALARFRTIAEHLGMPEKSGIEATRHVHGTAFERATIAPCNINYHLAHHLFPAVPFYRLPALHKRLMEQPEIRDHAHFKPTYLGLRNGVLGELVSRPPQ